MKTMAKDVRLADLPEAPGAVKGGGIKVPDAPRRPGAMKRPLQPCI